MQVGDVLQVVKDSFFPADLLLLAVPESPDGLAYVETINLDGESNLKIKKALDQAQHIRVDTMQDFTVTFWGFLGKYKRKRDGCQPFIAKAYLLWLSQSVKV